MKKEYVVVVVRSRAKEVTKCLEISTFDLVFLWKTPDGSLSACVAKRKVRKV